MRVPRLRSLLFLSIALPGSVLPGCRCGGGSGAGTSDPKVEASAFGASRAAPLSLTDMAALLARGRAVFEGSEPTALAAVPHVDGAARRVFLTAYSPPFAPQTTTALANTLDDAVTVAATELAPRAQPHALAATRLALDVVTSVSPVTLSQPVKVDSADIGLDGFAAQVGDRFTFVLPNLIVEERLFQNGKAPQIKTPELTAKLRGSPADGDPSSWTSFRFRTERVVEPLPSGDHHIGAALPLVRDMVVRPPPEKVTPALLVQAVKSGADYLARALGDGGHFLYMYKSLEDHEDSSYGLLRHAGAAYALFEAYDELRDPLYLDKGNRALGYLRSRFKVPTTVGGGTASTEPMLYLSDNAEEEQQKVGGNGLALLAYSKKAESTGSKEDLEVMRQLGLLIVRQQYPDGHFRSNEDVAREDPVEGKKRKKEVIYFAGEAILGLLRLYAVDPDPRWLDAARKGADFCVKVRDSGMTEKTIEHDHWLSYALNELERRVPDQAYVDHALLIATAIQDAMHKADGKPAPDYAYSFYAEAPSTPASVRLEALVADLRMMRFLGRSTDDLLPTAVGIASFTLGQQFDDENDFFLKNPARARGGVRESVMDDDVRIDFVQHALSGWLHLARVMRDPGYGAAPTPTLLDAGR